MGEAKQFGFLLDVGEGFAFGVPKMVKGYNDPDDDAPVVQVWETRLPACFFEVRMEGFVISTGSGRDMEELAHKIAEALSENMLEIRAVDTE